MNFPGLDKLLFIAERDTSARFDSLPNLFMLGVAAAKGWPFNLRLKDGKFNCSKDIKSSIRGTHVEAGILERLIFVIMNNAG